MSEVVSVTTSSSSSSSFARKGEFVGHSSFVIALEFDPSGTYVATGGYEDQSVRVWDVSTHEQVRCMQFTSPVRALSVSPRSTPSSLVLGVGLYDGSVQLMDGLTGDLLVACSPKHASTLWGCKFDASGKLLVTAGHDARVRVFSVLSGRCLTEHTVASFCYSVAVAQNSKYVAASTSSGALYLYSHPPGYDEALLESEATEDQLFTHPALDEEHIGGDSALCPYSTRDWYASSDDGSGYVVEFSADSELLFVARSRNIAVYRPESAAALLSFTAQSANVRSLLSSPTSEYLLSGSENKQFVVWRVVRNRDGNGSVEIDPTATVTAHGSCVRCMTICSARSLLATGSWDKTCVLWSVPPSLTFQGAGLSFVLAGLSEGTDVYKYLFEQNIFDVNVLKLIFSMLTGKNKHLWV